MFRNFFVLTSMSFFFLFNGAAFALSSPDVEKFLRSMEELKPFFDTFEETESLTDSEDDEDIDALSFDGIKNEILENIAGVEGIEEIVKKYGFSSPHQWAEIASQIIQVFVLSELESAVAELQAEHEAMKADSNSSSEELEGFEHIFAHLTREMDKLARAVPQSNIDVVKPYLPEIRNTLDD
jgi:soluble cytochrome b562